MPPGRPKSAVTRDGNPSADDVARGPIPPLLRAASPAATTHNRRAPRPGARLRSLPEVAVSEFALVVLVAVVLVVIVLLELAAAALPLLIVVILVPPAERPALAACLAATDSRKRLRLWPALRAAVRARRQPSTPTSWYPATLHTPEPAPSTSYPPVAPQR